MNESLRLLAATGAAWTQTALDRMRSGAAGSFGYSLLDEGPFAHAERGDA